MQRAVCKVQIIHHSSLRRHLSFIPFHSMNKNRNKLQLQHEHGHKQAQERCSQFADTPSAHHTRSHPLVPAFVFSSIASDKYIRQNPNERQANVLFKITSPSAFHFRPLAPLQNMTITSPSGNRPGLIGVCSLSCSLSCSSGSSVSSLRTTSHTGEEPALQKQTQQASGDHKDDAEHDDDPCVFPRPIGSFGPLVEGSVSRQDGEIESGHVAKGEGWRPA